MTIKDDGGPAFPVTAGQTVYSHGMLLRDWFAGQALKGLLTQKHLVEKYQSDWFASGAYRMADAMLAEKMKRSRE